MHRENIVFEDRIKYSLIFLYLLLIIDIFLLNRGITVMPTVCWGIVILFSILQKPETIMVMLMAIAPVTQAFQLSGSITTFPIMAAILIVKLVFRNRTVDKTFFILFMSLAIINGLSSMVEYRTIKYIIPFYTYFFMVYMVRNNIFHSKRLYELCMVCFLISVLIVCAGSKLLPVAADFMNNSTEYTIRNCGFSNVWDFGQNICISMVILLMALKRKRISYALALPLFMILGYFLIETGLYTALVGITIAVAAYPFLGNENGFTAKGLVVSLVVIVVAILIGYFIIYPKMFALRSQVSDNGRFKLWKQYIDIYSSDFRIALFGIGADSISAYAVFHGIRTTHNAIIEKIFEFGIIGVMLLVAGIFRIFRGISINPIRNYRIIYALVYFAMGLLQGISGAELIFLLLILASWDENDQELEAISA